MKLTWLLVVFGCCACSRPPTSGPESVGLEPRHSEPSQPFGQHRFRYADRTILPSSDPRAELDRATANFYEHWKRSYLETGCGPGQAYVAARIGSDNLTSSEAMGYGMLISVMMAGHDADARQHFDGLLSFVKAHQSALTNGLAARYQNRACQDSEGDNSAADGDLDIAYALLLADKQWGSCSGVDYAGQARRMIAAIAHADLHREGRYMLLGDWVAPSDRKFYNGTRSSDFMPGHFRGFQSFMAQAWWTQVVDNGYWLLQTVQRTHSPSAGLVPDFIEAADSEAPKPAEPGFVHDATDGSYGKHACRVPWRVGSDFLVSGDMRAKRFLQPLNAFVRSVSGDDPRRLSAGYALDGTALASHESMALTAPLGVSAMVDESHQPWLDRIWQLVVERPPDGYYEDSIRLLSMLVMSGNWWAPDRLPDRCAHRQTP